MKKPFVLPSLKHCGTAVAEEITKMSVSALRKHLNCKLQCNHCPFYDANPDEPETLREPYPPYDDIEELEDVLASYTKKQILTAYENAKKRWIRK